MIEDIRAKAATGAFELSRHALDGCVKRQIGVWAVCEAMIAGEVIEDYPQDKYGPSCLILGRTHAGRPLHVCAATLRG